jgi:hypothetical protein
MHEIFSLDCSGKFLNFICSRVVIHIFTDTNFISSRVVIHIFTDTNPSM